MAKTLKEILEVYEPKSPDEKRFKDKHIAVKTKDRNGNGDDVFQATNVKTVDREKERHGYNPGEDEKVYEATMTAANKAKEKKLKAKYDKSGMKASMQKQYGSEKGKQVYFAKIRGMAMEEVDYLNESVSQSQYDAHHAKAMKSLGAMAKHLDKHKKLCSKNPTLAWHAYDMKNVSRQLEDIEHEMANKNESQEMMNQPPIATRG